MSYELLKATRLELIYKWADTTSEEHTDEM